MANSKINFWSKEHVALFSQGLSDAEIAEKSGRTLNAVYNKRWNLENRTKIQKKAKAKRLSTSTTPVVSTVKAPKETTNLHFVVNGLNLYVANTCTNVLIGKNKVEVNF